jgi:hypothetical protein
MRAIDISGGFVRLHALPMVGVFVVWLGRALDATDFGLFSLVLKPAVTEILGAPARPPTSANEVVYWSWSACWAGRWSN